MTGRARIGRIARLLLLALFCQFGGAHAFAGPLHAEADAGDGVTHAAGHGHPEHQAEGVEHCADQAGDAVCSASVQGCPLCASACGSAIPTAFPIAGARSSSAGPLTVSGCHPPQPQASLYRPPIVS